MRELHCFDFDTLVEMEYKIRVIDIDRPEKTILYINKHEFFLILNGTYVKDNIKIDYNGQRFFISKELFDRIQKKRITPIQNLGISLSNLYDENQLDNTKLKFLLNNIKHLKDKKECDIAVMLDKNNRPLYQNILNKLRVELLKDNITIFKLYFLSDKITTRINQKIIIRKAEILLEHLIGLKIEKNSFVPLQQDKYDNVYFYDDDEYIITSLRRSLSDIFEFFYENSSQEIKDIITRRVKTNDLMIYLNTACQNDVNRFKTYDVDIINNVYEKLNHVKTFENF